MVLTECFIETLASSEIIFDFVIPRLVRMGECV